MRIHTRNVVRNRRDRLQWTQKTHDVASARMREWSLRAGQRERATTGQEETQQRATQSEMNNLFNRNKTFRPKKNHNHGTKRYDLHKRAQATLGNGDMRNAVAVPEGEDPNEWLAVHTVDFFNEISIIYGTIIEFCTAECCPQMSAGPKFEYLWKDNLKFKTPVKLAAPEYIDMLMAWAEDLLNDDTLFPTREGATYCRGFVAIVKNIFRRLFRVYAHVYYSHFDKIVSLGAEAHLNSCFKHFMAFVTEFDLVDKREQEPLKDLIKNLIG